MKIKIISLIALLVGIGGLIPGFIHFLLNTEIITTNIGYKIEILKSIFWVKLSLFYMESGLDAFWLIYVGWIVSSFGLRRMKRWGYYLFLISIVLHMWIILIPTLVFEPLGNLPYFLILVLELTAAIYLFRIRGYFEK